MHYVDRCLVKRFAGSVDPFALAKVTVLRSCCSCIYSDPVCRWWFLPMSLRWVTPNAADASACILAVYCWPKSSAIATMSNPPAASFIVALNSDSAMLNATATGFRDYMSTNHHCPTGCGLSRFGTAISSHLKTHGMISSGGCPLNEITFLGLRQRYFRFSPVYPSFCLSVGTCLCTATLRRSSGQDGPSRGSWPSGLRTDIWWPFLPQNSSLACQHPFHLRVDL